MRCSERHCPEQAVAMSRCPEHMVSEIRRLVQRNAILVQRLKSQKLRRAEIVTRVIEMKNRALNTMRKRVALAANPEPPARHELEIWERGWRACEESFRRAERRKKGECLASEKNSKRIDNV